MVATFKAFVKSHDSENSEKVLKFFKKHLKVINSMGVKLNITGYTADELRNKKLIDELKKQKINNLPAVITPNNVYEGAPAIINLFKRNMDRLNKEEQRTQRPEQPKPFSIENVYDYQQMMVKKKDDDEDEPNPTEDMNRKYHEMIQKRERMAQNYKGNKNVERSITDAPPDKQQQRDSSMHTDNISQKPDSFSASSSLSRVDDGSIDSRLMRKHLENNMGSDD
jgi:hypothetical protein